MRLPYFAIATALALLAATAASSQEGERYRLEKSGNGYVRMDTKTGEMSLCEEKNGQLVCKIAADERAAFQDDIDRLEDRVKTLDERVAKLENSLASRLESSLPTEEQFEKTMGYMERFFRGFVDIVKDLNKEEQAEPKPEPQRT